MKILIVLPTKTIKDALIEQGLFYTKKCRYPMDIKSIFIDPKDDPIKVTSQSYRIALDEQGKSYTSQDFVKHLSALTLDGKKISFIVGDYDGHNSNTLKAADEKIKLSDFTLPHRMAYLVLCEQIYRVGEILKNSPYHK